MSASYDAECKGKKVFETNKKICSFFIGMTIMVQFLSIKHYKMLDIFGVSNFFCNFAGMRNTLPEIIKQNENIRQLLLAQEGGIMKYLAEHLDANGTAELFSGYQDHCVEIFFEKNKWVYYKVWEGENMRRAALGLDEHLRKEIKYHTALKPQLATMAAEVVERIDWFVDLYLTHAYQLDRKRQFPQGQTDTEVYREVIDSYSSLGLASKCMNLIIREHHFNGNMERTEEDIWTDFLVRQWSDHFSLGTFAQMRNAVAEMLVGKDDKQCRQMATDTLEKVRGFSQKIYTDVVVDHLREMGYTKDADQRERDGEWLREVSERAVLEEFSDKNKPYTMRFYFANFANILKDVGRIWAAQLLVHNTDMKDLEKEVCCIMNPNDNLRYYVDRYYSNDLPGRYCISNDYLAEEKLKVLRTKENKGKKKKHKRKKANKNYWFTTATFTYKGMKTDLFKDVRLEIAASTLNTHFIKGIIRDKKGQMIDCKQYVIDFFSGTSIEAENTLIWKGNIVELTYLFRELNRKKRLEWSEDESFWDIVASHFKIETELKNGKIRKCNVTPDSLKTYSANPKPSIKKQIDIIVSYFNPDMSELLSKRNVDPEEETENNRNQAMAENDYSNELARERDQYKNKR